jgi:hypothetical protein
VLIPLAAPLSRDRLSRTFLPALGGQGRQQRRKQNICIAKKERKGKKINQSKKVYRSCQVAQKCFVIGWLELHPKKTHHATADVGSPRRFFSSFYQSSPPTHHLWVSLPTQNPRFSASYPTDHLYPPRFSIFGGPLRFPYLGT